MTATPDELAGHEHLAETQRLRDRADRNSAIWDWAPQMIVEQLDAAASLISVLHGEEAVIMGSEGLPAALRHIGQMPMTYSLCKYVVYAERPIRLTDLDEIEYLRDNKMVQESGALSYIGVPVVGQKGRVLGALCAVDTKRREWTDDELEVLSILANAVSQQLQTLN